MDTTFKKGDIVKYDNGKHQEIFVVENVGEHHLYSTKYNIPSFKKVIVQRFLSLSYH